MRSTVVSLLLIGSIVCTACSFTAMASDYRRSLSDPTMLGCESSYGYPLGDLAGLAAVTAFAVPLARSDEQPRPRIDDDLAKPLVYPLFVLAIAGIVTLAGSAAFGFIQAPRCRAAMRHS